MINKVVWIFIVVSVVFVVIFLVLILYFVNWLSKKICGVGDELFGMVGYGGDLIKCLDDSVDNELGYFVKGFNVIIGKVVEFVDEISVIE